MEEDKVAFEFKLTEQEYVAGMRKVSFSSVGMKVFFAILLALVLFQLISFVIDGDFSSTSPIVFLFIVAGVLIPYTIVNNARKLFKSNSRLSENVKYELGENGIDMKGETYLSDLPYKWVVKLQETKELLLIVEQKRQALIVPKRVLSEEQLITIRKRLTVGKN